MKRYNMSQAWRRPDPNGEWVKYEDVAALERVVDAARKLVKAKGRFQTEQNFLALDGAVKALEGK